MPNAQTQALRSMLTHLVADGQKIAGLFREIQGTLQQAELRLKIANELANEIERQLDEKEGE